MDAAGSETEGRAGSVGSVVESAFELLRNNAFEDAACDVQMEITVDLHAGRRRVSLSLNNLSVEKAAFKHMAGPGWLGRGPGLGRAAHRVYTSFASDEPRAPSRACDVRRAMRKLQPYVSCGHQTRPFCFIYLFF